jgi:hypothetical protein
MPMMIGHSVSVRPSKDSTVVLLAKNVAPQERTARGQPSCLIVWCRRVDETLSKAPLMSRNSADVTRLLPALVSIACVSAIAASIAARWGLLPIWSGCSRWWASTICAILEAINLSRIFPKQLSSAINLLCDTRPPHRTRVLPGLPGTPPIGYIAVAALWMPPPPPSDAKAPPPELPRLPRPEDDPQTGPQAALERSPKRPHHPTYL